MKLTDTCIDCLLSRVVFECELVSAGPARTEETVAACREMLESMRAHRSSTPRSPVQSTGRPADDREP